MRDFGQTLVGVFGAAILALASTVSAQQPTRTPSPSTTEQDAAIRAGVALHDQDKYDEAIARFQDVLKQNPDNLAALFELAYSYGAKQDHARSLETAVRGTEYQSDLLPMFYDLVGAGLDASGEPAKAIDAYKKGIAIAPDSPLLYHNMAVTYLESLKNPDEARRVLQSGAAIAPDHSPTQLLLGQIFQANGYSVPALLALSKFLILDPAGGQSLQAYGLWRIVLRGGLDAVGGSTGADTRKPRIDEGDFSFLESRLAPSHRAAVEARDSGQPEIQTLVGQLTTLLTALGQRDPGNDRPTFVWTHYVPYFVELVKKDQVETFVYWVCQRAPIPGVREWIASHQERVREFQAWTRQYATR